FAPHTGPLALPSFPTRRSSDLVLGCLSRLVRRALRTPKGIPENASTLNPLPRAVVVVPQLQRESTGADQVDVVVHDALFGLDGIDRKSTRLNSSHVKISYAVFC